MSPSLLESELLQDFADVLARDGSFFDKIQIVRDVFPVRPNRHTCSAGKGDYDAGILQRLANPRCHLLRRTFVSPASQRLALSTRTRSHDLKSLSKFAGIERQAALDKIR